MTHKNRTAFMLVVGLVIAGHLFALPKDSNLGIETVEVTKHSGSKNVFEKDMDDTIQEIFAEGEFLLLPVDKPSNRVKELVTKALSAYDTEYQDSYLIILTEYGYDIYEFGEGYLIFVYFTSDDTYLFWTNHIVQN